MKHLNVSNFKSHLAAHLREVQNGETIVLTEYRRPVAEVRPLPSRTRVMEPAGRPFSTRDCRPRQAAAGLAAALIAEERDGG
jgi:antitoxin (DNA-binding transcriptional repressor) of toxin-antitoxin stability system